MTLHGDTGLPSTEDALVQRLRALSADVAVSPDEDFRRATRARLVAMAAVRQPAAAATRRPPVRDGVLRRLVGSAADAQSSRWRTRLTAGLAGAALTVTALGGLFAAAQGARPGDLLYDLKRGGEQTQLALAGDSRRGTTLLDFATTRLDELQQLVGVQSTAGAVVGSAPSGGGTVLAAGPDTGLVRATVQTMDEQTTAGTSALTSRAVEQSDPHALQQLAGWAGGQQHGLGTLEGAMPTGTEGELTAARDLVGRVSTRATDLQTALGCAGGPSTSGADDLGPLPAPCAAPSPAPPAGSAPAGSPVPTSLPPGAAGTTTAAPGSSAPAVGTATAAPSGSAAPATTVPGVPTGSALPPVPVPTPSARPGLPLPSLPITLAPPLTPSPTRVPPPPVISVPSLVPGLSACLGPLISVGC